MVPLELHFKVSGGKKKRREKKKESYTLAETTLVWHLYMTAHLSPILTRKIYELAATLQSLRLKKRQEKEKSLALAEMTLFWHFIHDCTSLTHPDTKKMCSLADFRKL